MDISTKRFPCFLTDNHHYDWNAIVSLFILFIRRKRKMKRQWLFKNVISTFFIIYLGILGTLVSYIFFIKSFQYSPSPPQPKKKKKIEIEFFKHRLFCSNLLDAEGFGAELKVDSVRWNVTRKSLTWTHCWRDWRLYTKICHMCVDLQVSCKSHCCVTLLPLFIRSTSTITNFRLPFLDVLTNYP